MEAAKKIQDFARECVLMLRVVRENRPFTDMEFRLLETYVQMIALELALKKSCQMHVSKQTVIAHG